MFAFVIKKMFQIYDFVDFPFIRHNADLCQTAFCLNIHDYHLTLSLIMPSLFVRNSR